MRGKDHPIANGITLAQQAKQLLLPEVLNLNHPQRPESQVSFLQSGSAATGDLQGLGAAVRKVDSIRSTQSEVWSSHPIPCPNNRPYLQEIAHLTESATALFIPRSRKRNQSIRNSGKSEITSVQCTVTSDGQTIVHCALRIGPLKAVTANDQSCINEKTTPGQSMIQRREGKDQTVHLRLIQLESTPPWIAPFRCLNPILYGLIQKIFQRAQQMDGIEELPVLLEAYPYRRDNHCVGKAAWSQSPHRRDNHCVGKVAWSQSPYRRDNHCVGTAAWSQSPYRRDNHCVGKVAWSQSPYRRDNHCVGTAAWSQSPYRRDNHCVGTAAWSQSPHRRDNHCVGTAAWSQSPGNVWQLQTGSSVLGKAVSGDENNQFQSKFPRLSLRDGAAFHRLHSVTLAIFAEDVQSPSISGNTTGRYNVLSSTLLSVCEENALTWPAQCSSEAELQCGAKDHAFDNMKMCRNMNDVVGNVKMRRNVAGCLYSSTPVHSNTTSKAVPSSCSHHRQHQQLHQHQRKPRTCFYGFLQEHFALKAPVSRSRLRRKDTTVQATLLKFLLLQLFLSTTLALDFRVRIVLVERCNTSVYPALTNATSVLSSSGVASSVNFIFSQSSFCSQREALDAAAEIFQNRSEDLVIGLHPYKLLNTFAMFAALYEKPYISASFCSSVEIRSSFVYSLLPSYQQVASVFMELLSKLQWQEVTFLVSRDTYYQTVAREMRLHLASQGFTVRDKMDLDVNFTVAEAEEVLKNVENSAKAVWLVMADDDIATLLDVALAQNMATSHGFFLVIPHPYKSEHTLKLLSALGSQAMELDILNSVFVVALEFPPNTNLSSSRIRRSTLSEKSNLRSLTSRKQFEVPSYASGKDLKTSVFWSLMGKLKDGYQRSLLLLAESFMFTGVQRDVFTKRLEDEAAFTDEQSSVNTSLPFTPVQNRSSHTQNFSGDMGGDSFETGSQVLERLPRTNPQHKVPWLDNASTLHFVHRRSVESPDGDTSLLEESELKAVQDVVLAVGHALHSYLTSQSTSHPALPPPVRLLSLISGLDFQGTLGRVLVMNDSQTKYDAMVYDYNGKTQFVKKIFFSWSSNSTWEMTQTGSIVWPRGLVLRPDACFMDPECDKTSSDFQVIYVVVIFASIAGIAIIVTVIVFFVRRYWAKKEMSKGPNKVILSPDDLVFMLKKDIGKGSKLLKSRTNLMDQSKPDLLRVSDPSRSTGSLNELSDFTQTARYNGDLVHVKELNVKNFEMKSKIYTFVRMLRDLRHENVNPYVGFLVDPERPAMVMEYCSRGSLKDMLHNEDIKLDWDFKLSLLTDLVRGLRYIHNAPLKIHGHLTSRNCVIDSRFVLKITDYGILGFLEKLKTSRDLEARDLLWTAPELLRDDLLLRRGTDKGDVYSLSIIFQEVALRSEPYSSHALTQEAPPQFIQTMKQCWSEMPDMRPSVEEVYEQFKKLTGGKKANIVDTMFKMLEKYSNDLEDIVAERTEQLEEEKKKTDQLLYRMLPSIATTNMAKKKREEKRTVAESLKVGRNIPAETFSEVTIYFSDIVGFTTISAYSTPMQVVDLLNDLYTMFDATIERYDVYKVETIGDAYMVVSGLPIRNGNRHAGEISTMALELLSHCGHFTIKHMPEVPLRLRIGLHSGSCVAGVVGLTMPRYCLFGDTVNTASRMESTGAAFRIHVSQVVKDILDVLGGYQLDYRGETELKGKGKHKTWWLVGKDGLQFELPEPPPVSGEDNHGLGSIMTNIQLTSANPGQEPQTQSNNGTSNPPSTPPSNPEAKACQDNRARREGGRPDGQSSSETSEEGRPLPADAGFDSGKGESSDGDSPQTPKGPTGIGLPASAAESSGKSGLSGSRSPRKGGHSRAKATASFSEKSVNSGSKPKPQSVVTQAEIYPASLPVSSSTGQGSQSHGDSFILSSQPADVDTINEGSTVIDRHCVVKDCVIKTKLERKETGDSGVDFKVRNSVISSSDVSVHTTDGGGVADKGRKLTLEGREDDCLTPVTEA